MSPAVLADRLKIIHFKFYSNINYRIKFNTDFLKCWRIKFRLLRTDARWKWMLPVFQEKFEPILPNPGICLHFRATK
jgi:hypothetical protein